MASEITVENMDMGWLVKHAENKIYTSDLNPYVDSVLSELDSIVKDIPRDGIKVESEESSTNLYQLTKSFVHNSQIFLFADRLGDLYSSLEKIPEKAIDEYDKTDFNMLLDFISAMIIYDTTVKNESLSDTQKKHLSIRSAEIFEKVDNQFYDDDQYFHIMAKYYQGLIEKDQGEIDYAKETFKKCRELVFDNLDLEQVLEKVKNVEEPITDGIFEESITEEDYHILELAGRVELNAAKLEAVYPSRERLLKHAVEYMKSALSACPEHINDITARYDLMHAYSTLAGEMMENNQEGDMEYLLNIFHQLHGLKDAILTVSPYLSEDIGFVYSVTESYDNIIEPMFEKVRSGIELLGLEHEKGYTNIRDVCDSASDIGLKPETIKAVLRQLARQGDISRPEPDYIKLIVPKSPETQ